MKIGVIAGSFTDTNMGCELIEKYGHIAISLPISKNCVEQSKTQYYSKEKLNEIFMKKCELAIKQGAKKILLYCNSLSCVVDYETVSSKLGIDIITPLEVYKNLPSNCKNIAILGANGLSAFNIDRIIQEHNKDSRTITYGNISIVEMIEERLEPKDIMEKLNLESFINYLENIRLDKFKIDTVLLGCTHFPYIKQEIQKITNLKIIDPSIEMINKI